MVWVSKARLALVCGGSVAAVSKARKFGSLDSEVHSDGEADPA
jgi:hypothetical protein